MRYHIDTIPVWDAYKTDTECPLCDLQQAAEAQYLDSFLGASVMEPDVRIEVNEKGFCARHFARMLPMKNRLGLSLMTHTHLKETIKKLPAAAPGSRLFAKKSDIPQAAETCILCDRLDVTMMRYITTIVHLWKTDKDFQKAFLSSKGLCLPHYYALRADSPKDLAEALDKLEKENLDRIEKELEWFTLKFDYRNREAPWGNSKDAPERAILKLRGAGEITKDKESAP